MLIKDFELDNYLFGLGRDDYFKPLSRDPSRERPAPMQSNRTIIVSGFGFITIIVPALPGSPDPVSRV